VQAGTATAANLRSTIGEYVHAAAAAQQAASLRDFTDKPLVVLTAGAEHDAAWSAAQNRLAALSTHSAHHVVDGATHESLVANREHAATATQAILQVVAAVRSAGPVPR
jgi:nucleoside phosphorylase